MHADWPTIAGDFREMKDLGANVARAHLQLGKFLAGPDRPNTQTLDWLSRDFNPFLSGLLGRGLAAGPTSRRPPARSVRL